MSSSPLADSSSPTPTEDPEREHIAQEPNEDTKAFSVTSEQWENHSFYNLFATGVFSDCEVVCKDHTFKGHICVLASSCAYFEKALCGNFLEGESRKLDLSEDDWDLVKATLKYIYGCAYNNIIPGTSKFRHIQLYSFADRLGYKALKDACTNFLRKMLHARAANFASLK
ncbi:Hypothetical protein D9617_2g059090 [Elsinoe fawcettii]|nr:Hypothetical protein D9617_2g059090 [Elsinoe fawcettii]